MQYHISGQELLDLEEKMGSVSTALSEEALSKCLKRSIYQPLSPKGVVECGEDENQGKCSICQVLIYESFCTFIDLVSEIHPTN